MRRLDFGYLGFRGYAQKPGQENVSLEPMSCAVCGRTRNVSRGDAVEQSGGYVCPRCRKEQGMEVRGFAQDG